MQTNEITSLNQLQVELVKNGFGKNVNDNPTDEEDIVPSPGHFAVNYITVPCSMDWQFEPRTEVIIAPGKVSHLFEKREDGFPLLSERDESTITPGMFLCGPSVRHDNHDFCFIYKYRQRFAVVAEEIARREHVSNELLSSVVQDYAQRNFYLSDLSCCDDECVC